MTRMRRARDVEMRCLIALMYLRIGFESSSTRHGQLTIEPLFPMVVMIGLPTTAAGATIAPKHNISGEVVSSAPFLILAIEHSMKLQPFSSRRRLNRRGGGVNNFSRVGIHPDHPS